MAQDDEHSTVLEQGEARSALVERRVSLVVTHRDGVDVVPLEPGQPLVIGRSEPADVRFRCDKLSRRHARVELIGGEVWIEDLASTNGTFLHGKQVKGRLRLKIDDEVGLGTIRLRLHVMTAWEARLQGVENHDRFERELEEEVERARTFGRSVSLLLIQARGAGADAIATWGAGLRERLRTVDRVGLYGPSTLEVLLPEADASVARQIVGQLRQSAGPELRVGVAVFPAAGSVQQMLSGAVAALRRTTAARPVEEHGGAATPEVSGPLVRDPQMVRLYQVVDRLAPARVPVLILGETGTGKELVAQALHARSRRKGPLRTLNCGAIPAQLLESALFGHEKGAFTGADSRRKGLFEEADGGTVFLDEVGELSPAAQVALLRVLETHHVARVGGHAEIAVDVRVVAATHRDLPTMCDEGTFRLDLFYRLETMTLRIPPLRARPLEIAPLAERFLADADDASGRGVREISPVAMSALELYAWPGNVRELRNVIERAVVVCDGTRIRLEDLPDRVQQARTSNRSPTPSPTYSVHRPAGPRGGGWRGDPAPWQAPVETPVGAERARDLTLRPVILACESALIRRALVATADNQSEAARLLHMPRRTLIYKLRALEADEAPGRGEADEQVLAEWSEPGDERLDFRSRVEAVEERVLRAGQARVGAKAEVLAGALGIHPRTLAAKLRKYGLDDGA